MANDALEALRDLYLMVLWHDAIPGEEMSEWRACYPDVVDLVRPGERHAH